MLLERTISQLDIGHVTSDQANEMGQLGYLQWLGSLPANANYAGEAMRAYQMARPFWKTSPAIAVFCTLLIQSTGTPPAPLSLTYPSRVRRVGAQRRRIVF